MTFRESLDLLKQYHNRGDLVVNILKTKTMVFRKRGDIFENEKWYFDGKLLQTVSLSRDMFQSFRQFYLKSRITCWNILKAMNYLLYNLRK